MSILDKSMKFNLLGTMSRSYDTFHIENQIIHLVMTCTYWGNLDNRFIDSNLNTKNLKKILFIKIIDSLDTDICYEFETINDNTQICTYSVGYILNNIGAAEADNKLLLLLVNIFGNKIVDRKPTLSNPNFNNLYNCDYPQGNVYFIFENLHWFNVKHIFNMMGITISGGTISNRHLLSITQLNLMRMLFILNFGLSAMWQANKNNYLKRNLYNTIKRGYTRSGSAVHPNVILYHLFFQSLEELHSSNTELLILIQFILYYKKIELKASKATQSQEVLTSCSNAAASEATNVASNFITSCSKAAASEATSLAQLQYLKSSNSGEDINQEYLEILKIMMYLHQVYSNYIVFLDHLWDKFEFIGYDYNFEVDNLFEHGRILDTEEAYRFESISNLNSYSNFLIDLYTNLFNRRKNLVLNNDYTKYVNSIFDQKLPSSKGNNYDLSAILDNTGEFDYSSILALKKKYKTKMGIGLIPGFNIKKVKKKIS